MFWGEFAESTLERPTYIIYIIEKHLFSAFFNLIRTLDSKTKTQEPRVHNFSDTKIILFSAKMFAQ